VTSFVRSFLARRPQRPSAPPWAAYGSAEEFSEALMRAGTDTDEARMLLRRAQSYFSQRDAEERRREAAEYRAEMSEYGAEAAAEKLMRETGYPVDGELDPAGPRGVFYDGPSEWQGLR
jgi:hypothetical protein